MLALRQPSLGLSMLFSLKDQLVIGAPLAACAVAALLYQSRKRKADKSEEPATPVLEKGTASQRKFGGEFSIVYE